MLILAPMQGLTELLFRKTFSRCYPGAFDMSVSPFLSLTHGNLKDAGKKVEDVLPELNEGSIPVVPQLLGHEIEGFIDLSNRLFDIGYEEVNWNMGCPMRRVAGKHRGSGILPFPNEVREILDAVVPAMKPQLSVKVRLGYRSSDEIDRIIPILNDYPLRSVTVHPRIGKQMYSGTPDLNRFAEILPLIKHPVIYNGDVNSVYDYQKIRSRFPSVKDVMIGRGALYNPQLPSMIKKQCPEDFVYYGRPAYEEKLVGGELMRAEQFINELTEDILKLDISDQAKIRKIKEYWCLLSKSLSGSEQWKRRLLHCEDLAAMRSLIFEMTK